MAYTTHYHTTHATTQHPNEPQTFADVHGTQILGIGIAVVTFVLIGIIFKHNNMNCAKRRKYTDETFSEHDIYNN